MRSAVAAGLIALAALGVGAGLLHADQGRDRKPIRWRDADGNISEGVKVISMVVGSAWLIGFLLFGFSFHTAFKSVSSRSWPKASATVTVSKTGRRRRTGRRRGTRIVPIIHYVYTVDGVEHTGRRLRYSGNFWGPFSTAREIVDEHPVGRKLDIHHHPKKHGQAVAYPGGVFAGHYFVMLLGLFFIGVGAWILVDALTR